MEKRIFSLGTVLSITTGIVYAEMEKVYDALEYLQQSSIFTHQLPLAADIATLYIYTKYPKLINVGKNKKFKGKEAVFSFLEKAEKKYGKEFELEPIPNEFLVETGIINIVNNSSDEHYIEDLNNLLNKKEKQIIRKKVRKI